MVTIQSLPEELLLIVVQMVQGQEGRSHSARSRLSRSRSMLRSLLRLSLVCKDWRETTLKYGALWASIAVDTSRGDCLVATLAMLERSKGVEVELSVCFRADYAIAERTSAAVASILDHRARITSLHLTADPLFMLENNTPASETAAHTLTTTNSFSPTPSRCISGLFRRLRNLSLSLPSPSTVVRISELLDIVKNSQELESLSLTSFLFIREDSTCVVHPPKLLRLSLRECDSATILSRLVAPKTAVINITLKDRRVRGYPPLHGVHILGALPPSLSSIRALEETTKLIFEEDEKGHYFGLGLASFRSRGSIVAIRIRSSSRERFIRASLRAISDHPYFDIIESFTFSYSSRVPMSWPIVFSRFGALLELNASTVHAADILHTLVQTAFDGTPLCSSLRRIRFFDQPSNRGHVRLDSDLFTVFRSCRAEYHCSAVRITLHYLDGRKEEL